MSDLVYRAEKGSPLTSAEADNNIAVLNGRIVDLAATVDNYSNNKGLYIQFGELVGTGEITRQEVATAINALPWILVIGKIVTPVTFEFTRNGKKYLFDFLSGKGWWGSVFSDGTDISALSVVLKSILNTTEADIDNNPAASLTTLGNIPDGDYLTIVNSEQRDFSDSGTQNENGAVKTYYFSYVTESVLYFVQFVGDPGIYDGDLEATDFVASTNSNVIADLDLQNKVDKPSPLPSTGEIVVVGVDDQGNSTSIPTKELFIIDETTTPYNSIDALINIGGYSAANGFVKGTQIVCKELPSPKIYLKTGDNDTDWTTLQLSNIPLE
ncbi:MAG: hypothetical protein BM557_09515 [Flavobacterium sp. MedPE-SWcel]|uniref:hypothetical protein n=1 Tax=uncultured Flavobacterium sp. TaxID=165435 RepID=UPI000918842D|nr:hypothetical protein [uncultured Flavobacterium sp.]OIQ16542.1 MAG: hypothetical protein BM557_09515 [Flavobacterium sp. MedPE-SWcel]